MKLQLLFRGNVGGIRGETRAEPAGAQNSANREVEELLFRPRHCFQAEQHGSGPVHYAGTLREELVLEIYPLADGETDGTIRMGFLVDNLDNVIAAMEAAGAIVISWPRQTKWGLQGIVRDLDGRKIEVTQK